MSAYRSLRGRNRANIRGQPLRLKETKKNGTREIGKW